MAITRCSCLLDVPMEGDSESFWYICFTSNILAAFVKSSLVFYRPGYEHMLHHKAVTLANAIQFRVLHYVYGVGRY